VIVKIVDSIQGIRQRNQAKGISGYRELLSAKMNVLFLRHVLLVAGKVVVWPRTRGRRRIVRNAIASYIAILALFTMTRWANAQIQSKSNTLIVIPPSKLPELAQTPGNSLFLHNDNEGRVYLYVEQLSGARLAVFDVTDPARVKVISSKKLDVPGPFDFVRPLGDSLELIRFRDNKGVGVLDLHRPGTPIFRMVPALSEPGPAESLGDAGLLFINEPYNYIPAEAHDYQIVDLSVPGNPSLLATVKQVKHRVTREETGTTYLLGSSGLTVIRRPRVEQDYQVQLQQQNSN
jgi:hypothetical protein